MNLIVDIVEDLSYYQISLEKQAFLDVKSIPVAYNGARLAFINSKDKCVFYKKENN